MDDFIKNRDKIVDEIMYENLLFHQDNLELNMDKFINGEYNFCLLTGLVGSGLREKTIEMSRKYKAYEINIGDVYNIVDDEYRNVVLKNFINIYDQDVNNMLSRGLTSRERNTLVLDYLCFAIQIAKNNKHLKFIIRGPEIFWMYYYVKDIEKYPIIFLNTPLLKSTLSDAKARIDSGESPKKVLKNLIKFRKIYKQDHDILQNMQKEFIRANIKEIKK